MMSDEQLQTGREPHVLVVQVDPAANAAYLRISDSSIAKTEELNDWTLVDLDPAGKLVGVEILGLSSPIPLTELQSKFGLSEQAADLIGKLKHSIAGIWSHGVSPDTVRTLPAPILFRA